MREQLLARMRSLGSLQPPAEATACLEVSTCCRGANCMNKCAWLAGLPSHRRCDINVHVTQGTGHGMLLLLSPWR
jgi:hypothetical protein